MIAWICVLSVLCAAALCLYLANGQLSLFEPGGLKQAFGGVLAPTPKPDAAPAGSTPDEDTDPQSAEPDSPVLQPVALAKRVENLKRNRRLWVFGALSAAAGVAFYAYRAFALIDAPALNAKFLALFFVFLAEAVVDAQYYVIPNQVVGAELALWLVLTVYTVLVEGNPLLSVLAFSLIGFVFGGGVLLMCRLLMRGSLGMGDVKLMAVTGLVCGFHKTFNILFYGLFFSFLCGVVLLLTKKADRNSQIPMAPFLFCGYLFANLIAI